MTTEPLRMVIGVTEHRRHEAVKWLAFWRGWLVRYPDLDDRSRAYERESSLPLYETAPPPRQPPAASLPRPASGESVRPAGPWLPELSSPRRPAAEQLSLGQLLQPERSNGGDGLVFGGAVGLGLMDFAGEHLGEGFGGLVRCHVSSKPCLQSPVNMVYKVSTRTGVGL